MTIISAERLRPIIERYAEAHGLNNRRETTLPRRLYRVLNEVEHLDIDTADRLLRDMDMLHEWHGELSDIYEETPDGPYMSQRRCRCGCGQLVGFATQTRRDRGHVKGFPVNYVAGHNPRTPRRLTHEQIRAAYTIYQSGMTVEQIAELSWKHLGFGNTLACESALFRAFYTQGRKLRSLSESQLWRYRDKRCAGCGCEMDVRTRGCQQCSARHLSRRNSGLPYVKAKYRHVCSGCEGSLNETTEGCAQCVGRHDTRLRRLRRNELAAQPPVAVPRRASVHRASLPSPKADPTAPPSGRVRTPLTERAA